MYLTNSVNISKEPVKSTALCAVFRGRICFNEEKKHPLPHQVTNHGHFLGFPTISHRLINSPYHLLQKTTCLCYLF